MDSNNGRVVNNYLCSQANVRQYYQQFEEQQTQSLIDQKVKEHLGQTAAALAQQQVGGAVYSHLATSTSNGAPQVMIT